MDANPGKVTSVVILPCANEPTISIRCNFVGIFLTAPHPEPAAAQSGGFVNLLKRVKTTHKVFERQSK
jgi:hypothetical protein